MVDYPFVTSYAVGNASVDAGGLTVTGQGTFWQDNANPELSPIRAGDLFGTHKGFAIRILEVVSATELTLAHPWPGVDQDLAEYEIQLTPRIVGAQQATRLLQKQLASGNLSAFAALEGQSNLLPMFSGAGTMTLVTKQSLVSGADYDVQANNLAGRAVYDSRPANFRVLVADIGDGRSAIYSKNSSAAADWSAPAIITGPQGPDGVNPRGNYDPATAYATDDLVYSGGSTWIAKTATTGNAPPTLPTTENTQWRIFARAGSAGVNPRGAYASGTTYAALDVVLDNGSSWIAKVSTTGNAPPVLPTTENTYWTLLAAKGADGAGTGDVVGPNGGVTVKQIAGFGSNTGKDIVGLTPAEVRAAAGFDVLTGFRNKIINGNFSVWQRGLTQTTSGYGSSDRWSHNNSGSTKTVSRQPIGPGAFPFEDRFYCRTVVSSVAGSGSYVLLLQAIEDVRTLAGKKATVTFWARTTGVDKPIAVEILQNFGTGGSPSAQVSGIDVKKVVLSSTLGISGFQKYSLTFDIPSISGKTIGTNEDSSLRIAFWFDAGSDYNSRSASLGQQSGTFDVAHVSLVAGDATGEMDPFSPRHPQQEFALCQRYFQKTYQEDVAPGTPLSVPGLVEGRGDGGNYAVLGTFSFNVWMRAAPSITIYNYATGAVGTGRLASNNTDIPVASSLAGSRGVKIYVNNTQTPAVGADIQVHFTANSEI